MIRPATRMPTQPRPLSIRDFRGMDVTGTRDVRRSPDMMNCILDDEGTPEMRCGFEKAYETSLGEGPILGIHKWRSATGTIKRIIHHGTKLYVCDNPGDQPVEVYSGMSGLRHSTSFELATKLGIIDGTKFVVFNGTTAVDAETIAYIPTFLIGTPPAGGGTRNEDLNIIQPRWKQSFSTVAGTMIYQMWRPVDENGTVLALDALEYVWLNGVLKTLTTDYTVNLATGVLTLVANPGAGTNNLVVQPRKTISGVSSRILKCTVAKTYGGPSDSRVFTGGNPDYPHIDWWTGLPLSGVYDLTYWPDSNFDRVGGDNDPIVGYAVQYDKMIVLKQNSAYLRSWEIIEDGFGRTVTRFPSVNLNAGCGCVEADSIALIDNNPFFLSEDGMKEIKGTNVRDERNVRDVSPLIQINSLGHAVGIDHYGKYYLSAGDGIVWVCDYSRTLKDEATGSYVPVWYPWSGLDVNYWCSDGETLLYGSSTTGMVYRQKSRSDDLPYNDDGEAITPCYYRTIWTTFDRDDMTKLVQKVTITQKPYSRSSILVSYATEDGETLMAEEDMETLDFLDFDNLDFDRLSFVCLQLPRAFTTRIDDARNIQMFQLYLHSSGDVDDFFGFKSIDILFQYLSGIR